MEKWVSRISRAALMGLAWAVVWVPIAVLIGTKIVDPDDSMDEMWWMVGAIPGFLCGAIFSATVGIADGRRRLDELSFSRAAAWGAVSGLLVGVLPFVLGSQNESERTLWILPVVVIGSVTLMSAASAVASALLARSAKKGKWLGARAEVS